MPLSAHSRVAATVPNLSGWERAAVVAALAGVAILAWLYLLETGSTGSGMDAAMPTAWSVSGFLLTLAMWLVMMVGMMLPSAAPMIMTFVALNRGKRRGGQAVVSPVVFVSGYLLVWAGFSVLATGVQCALSALGWLSPMLAATGGTAGGVLFLIAAAYQLAPLKGLCLRNCRSPFAFLLNNWRDGAAGALRMGIVHGLWCVGCCWLLMALLFVFGVMNLVWVAGLAAFILAEKVLPNGIWFARAGGLVMAAVGIWLLAQPWVAAG